MKILIKYGLLILTTTCLWVACTKDSFQENMEQERIDGSIKDMMSQTKATIEEGTGVYVDGGFKDGDAIGFYSSKGYPSGTNPYNGDKFLYSSAKGFVPAETGKPIAEVGKLGKTFAYFPFDEKSVNNKIGIYKEDKVLKDIVIASGEANKYGIAYAFDHVFSAVHLFLGDGFKSANNDEQIEIHLKEPIYDAEVIGESSGFSFRLNKTGDGDIQKEDRSCLIAKKVDNLYFGTGETKKGYFSLLPAGVDVIDYISLMDDDNNMVKVRPHDIFPELKAGTRHIMTIQKTGVSAVIYPYPIAEWEEKTEEDEDGYLTIPYGIKSAKDFADWIVYYNNRDIQAGVSESLTHYGTMSDDGVWTFPIMSNIDFSEVLIYLREADERLTFSTIIPSLKNTIIEGQNYTISNVVLDGSDANMGFIGEIAEGGIVRNLNIEGIQVVSDEAALVGGITASMSGGEVTGCKVNNIQFVCPNAIVGGFAGRMSGGTASNCVFGGSMTGKGSDEKWLGENIGGKTNRMFANGLSFKIVGKEETENE